MPTKDATSPFSPGNPVAREYFVGRLPEIERLKKKVQGSLTGRLEAAFIAGERGIGKSSLASFVGHLCEKSLNTLTIHTFLGGVDTLESATRAIFDKLVRVSADKPFAGKVREFLGNRVTEAGLFGVSIKFDPRDQDLATLASNFVPAMANLIDKLKDDRAGLILILDDLNGLVSVPRFAHWIKSFVDEVATSRTRLPLCLLLVGLEERRRALIEHNPSVARIFDLIDLRPWSDKETSDFYLRRFESAGLSVDETALSLLLDYTGGLPVLAHEIGDAAFRMDTDGHIGFDDATGAVLSAAEVVGRKHIDPLVLDSIRSKKYRVILRTLADSAGGEQFTRAELKGRLGDAEERVMDNFLQRMKSKGVIEDMPEEDRGSYRFTNRLHYLYFVMEARRTQRKGAADDE